MANSFIRQQNCCQTGIKGELLRKGQTPLIIGIEIGVKVSSETQVSSKNMATKISKTSSPIQEIKLLEE
jgi:hypothetical protein